MKYTSLLEKETTMTSQLATISNLKILKEKDLEFILEITKMIKPDTNNIITLSKRACEKDAIDKAVDSFQIFNDKKITRKAKYLANNITIYPILGYGIRYITGISYEFYPNTSKIDTNSGKVTYLKTPSYFDQSSYLGIGFELTHVLKDTNYREYINYLTYKDFISYFYLMIQEQKAEQYIYTSYWKNIMSKLYNKKNIFTELYAKYQENQEKYQAVLSSYGQDFLSFYYAALLYQIYLEKPVEVLKEVNKVLKKQSTSTLVLKKFDLYQSYDVEIALAKIKKYQTI